MALDCYIGLFPDGEDATWGEAVLAEINVLLATAGLPLHVEPREEHACGPRLGFYSSTKYAELDTICRQLTVQGRVTADALTQPWTESVATHPPLRRLAHLSRAWNGRTFCLPLRFESPILSAGREVSALISAPMVIEEAALLRLCVRGVEAWDWRWWERTQTAERLGLCVPEDDALERHLGNAVDLAGRLSGFAEVVLSSGAVGYTG
jgi:hypothetical protein